MSCNSPHDSGTFIASLDQVEQRKHEHPDQVHKMPVESRQLDTLRTRLPHDGPQQNDCQENHAGKYVRAVESCNQKEIGTEVGDTPWIGIELGALHDQAGPLVR